MISLEFLKADSNLVKSDLNLDFYSDLRFLIG